MICKLAVVFNPKLLDKYVKRMFPLFSCNSEILQYQQIIHLLDKTSIWLFQVPGLCAHFISYLLVLLGVRIVNMYR